MLGSPPLGLASQGVHWVGDRGRLTPARADWDQGHTSCTQDRPGTVVYMERARSTAKHLRQSGGRSVRRLAVLSPLL